MRQCGRPDNRWQRQKDARRTSHCGNPTCEFFHGPDKDSDNAGLCPLSGVTYHDFWNDDKDLLSWCRGAAGRGDCLWTVLVLGMIWKRLSERASHVVFLQWRKKRAEVKGAGIEFTKSDLEPPAADLLRQVTGDPVVEHCPEGKCLAEWPPCHSAKKKRRGMLGFDDERFQSASGDNAEVRVGHIDPNSTAAAPSQLCCQPLSGTKLK